MSLALLLALVLVLSTCAWGPGHHLEFEARVFRRREHLPSQVRRLIEEERPSWQYGQIAADIINMKAYGGHKNHCHRWSIVEEMRALARSPEEEAFALGYLAHLAADTIAHNHFVPYHLARFARGRGLGHVYWEMNADRFVPEARWRVISQLKADPELDALDDLINRTVPRKALSMGTNKLVFNHVLLVSERDRWRAGLERLHPLRHLRLERGFLERFRVAAVKRIQLALRRGGVAKLDHIDTTGKAAQQRALAVRTELVRATRPGPLRAARAAELAAPFLAGMETPPLRNGASAHWSAD
jgi:hypothetical protein